MGKRVIKHHIRTKCRHCGGKLIPKIGYDVVVCEKCGWARGVRETGEKESGYFFHYGRGNAKTGFTLLEGIEEG